MYLLNGEMFANEHWPEMRDSGCLCSAEGRNFVLSSKKVIVMKPFGNLETLLTADFKKSSFYFFFFSLLQSSGPQPHKIIRLACCRCQGSRLKAQR